MIGRWLRNLPANKLSRGQVFHLHLCAFLLPVVLLGLVADLRPYGALVKVTLASVYIGLVFSGRTRR